MISKYQKRVNEKKDNQHDYRVMNDDIYSERWPNSKSFRYRSKWYCNLTNGWALPPELGTLEYALLQRGTDPKAIQTALAELLSALPEEYGLESTIWSYLPENQTKMGDKGINIKHPTVKPRRLIKRIIQLCCPPATEDYTPIVADPFGGSGTTPVVCAELDLNCFSCDIDEQYCKIANKRIELAKAGHDGAGFDFKNIKEGKKRNSVQLDLF